MEAISLHLQVLFEAIWTASLVPLGNDTAFFAMSAFGSHNMLPAVILSIIGATLGQLFNYYIGRWLQKVKYTRNMTLSEGAYERFEYYFNTYGIYVLVFSWGPLCKLLPVLAGFSMAPRRKVILIIMAGYLYYYGQVLFV